MVKLHRRDNIFSVNKIRNSTPVELDDIVYYGNRLTTDDSGENYYVITLAGDNFKLTQDNLNILLRTSFINDGLLIGPYNWQTYKNKSMFLPIGTLNPKPLNYGDIVEPVLPSRFNPTKLIYLGEKHIVEYSTILIKKVKKSQHIFVSLDDPIKRVINENLIDSAFFVIKNDVALADELSTDINTNKISQRHPWMDKYGRPFYVDDYHKTKIKPKLVPIENVSNSLSAMNIQDARIVIKHDDSFYDVKYTTIQSLSPNIFIRGYLVKNIEILDEPFIANINYGFRSSKYMENKEVDIGSTSSYECYVIAYELWQDGKVIGRK